MTDNLTVAVESPPEPKQRRRKQPADAAPKKQPPYAVVVFNDDLHTFKYVIETFTKLFGYLAGLGFDVTGVDISPTAIALAEADAKLLAGIPPRIALTPGSGYTRAAGRPSLHRGVPSRPTWFSTDLPYTGNRW